MVCDEHFRPQKSLFTSVPPHFILPRNEDFILFYFICTSLQFHISLFFIYQVLLLYFPLNSCLCKNILYCAFCYDLTYLLFCFHLERYENIIYCVCVHDIQKITQTLQPHINIFNSLPHINFIYISKSLFFFYLVIEKYRALCMT